MLRLYKISAVVVFICLMSFSFANGSDTATIVFHVEGLTISESNSIIQKLIAEHDVTLEYSCDMSGVFVFKLNQSSLVDKADVKVFFYNRLKGVIPINRIEVLHTDIQFNNGASKC